MLTGSLLSQDLPQIVKVLNSVCTMISLRRVSLPETVMPQLRGLVDDLLPPEGDDALVDAGCRTPAAVDLAQSIYQERDFQRMPELAELLEEAGCSNRTVLDHCRSSDSVHIRGCWVLDEVLGEFIAKPVRKAPKRRVRKRHQILGRELHETREKTLELLAQDEAKYRERTKPGRPNQQFRRELYLDSCVACAVLEHLGYGPIENLASWLDGGVTAALDYFFGDWWEDDEEDAIALDKSRPDRELQWNGALMSGLLLAGLTGHWDDAAKLCSWVDSSIQLEHRFELDDYEYQWLHLCIASELRPEPLEGIDEMLEALRQCRPKHPRMLCAAWEAAVAKDQKAFDKALKESVHNFLNVHAQNVPNMCFWVALDESLIWLLAERNNLEFPALPEKMDAAIVRRQTVGRTN